jgi:DNA-binding NtrC family response regulator
MKRPITMLVADDSHLIQQVFTEAARSTKLELRINSTDNGRDCLTLLSGGNVDLAFIDVHMPELSGMDAFWTARKQGIKTFVTLMSNPPSLEAVEMARKLKAYEVLFKPFDVNEVRAIIKTYDRIAAPTKVLIVDDSHTVRKIVQKVVQGSIFNCEIAEAADGETALNLCRSMPFDVVFLDRNMPGLSGLNTLKRMLAIDSKLKIVMNSAEHDVTEEKLALETGACTFLHKPFYSVDVDRVLHQAFGLRSPHLKIECNEPEFDMAVEGSTVCVIHKDTGHTFEYLWFREPPYLRNGIVQPAKSSDVAPGQVAAAAEKVALMQLRSAKLLPAAA